MDKNIVNQNNFSGVLSDTDIKNFIEKTKDIIITPFEEENLTGIGYNLTPTNFVFSTKKGRVEKIHKKNNEEFVYIKPNDTVLILSRESIYVSNKIMGLFHSKVRIVSLGFGHTSTTLDPLWEGPLLFSLNNPTSKKIKLLIQKTNPDNNELIHNSIVTLTFFSLFSPSTKIHDNPSSRIDILKQYKKKGRKYKEIINICQEIDELGPDFTKIIKDKLINININGDKKRVNEIISEFKKYNQNYIENVNLAVNKIQNKTKYLLFFEIIKSSAIYILSFLYIIFFILNIEFKWYINDDFIYSILIPITLIGIKQFFDKLKDE